MIQKKTVLITGSSRGIGGNMAEKFAREGYNVLINYNKSKGKAEELQARLQVFCKCLCKTYDSRL